MQQIWGGGNNYILVIQHNVKDFLQREIITTVMKIVISLGTCKLVRSCQQIFTPQVYLHVHAPET